MKRLASIPLFPGFSVFGLGAHTRTIQARHMVRGLLSETSTNWEWLTQQVFGLGI